MDMANEEFGALAAYPIIAGIDADPQEFMKMAIDAVRVFLLQTEAGIAAGNRPAKARALDAAAKVIEFMLGLSGSEPGPLSDSLAQVYRYVLAAILRGNAAGDAEAVAAGRVVVEQFAEVWRRAFPDTDILPAAAQARG
jgi:flagellin-specific chaperone FliS